MMKKNQSVFRISIIVVAIVGVFLQSFIKGDVSTSGSSWLANLIYDFFGSLSDGDSVSAAAIELILRKFGHLIEYLLLGSIVFGVYLVMIQEIYFVYILTIITVVPIPFIDELIIQANTLGRSPKTMDIGIDLLGLALALIIGSIYLVVFKQRNRGGQG